MARRRYTTDDYGQARVERYGPGGKLRSATTVANPSPRFQRRAARQQTLQELTGAGFSRPQARQTMRAARRGNIAAPNATGDVTIGRGPTRFGTQAAGLPPELLAMNQDRQNQEALRARSGLGLGLTGRQRERLRTGQAGEGLMGLLGRRALGRGVGFGDVESAFGLDPFTFVNRMYGA